MPSDVASLALKLSQKTKRNGSRAMALNGKSKEAYRFLLKSMDRKANNKILLSIMSWAPGAFRPLLRDRAKLAFATGL